MGGKTLLITHITEIVGCVLQKNYIYIEIHLLFFFCGTEASPSGISSFNCINFVGFLISISI